MQTKQPHVILHTLFLCLLTPAPTPRPSTTNPLQADTQSSTLLRSRCPNHLNLPRLTTSATQLIPRRLHKSPSVLQGHPTHPSHHHTFCPFQTSQIISLHCPFFSSIYQNTLDTSTIDPSFDTIRCTTHSQNRSGLVVSAPTWDGTSCEFDSWQCRIYIPCSLSLRLLGSLRGSWVHMA